MTPFEQTVTAAETDIDARGHVSNIVWVRWDQDVAAAPLEQPGVARAARRLALGRRPPRDRSSAQPQARRDGDGATWVGDAPRGAKFDRRVEFVGADGMPFARAKTSWAMIDRASGRPKHVPPEMAARFLS